jgi:hypothetical protein
MDGEPFQALISKIKEEIDIGKAYVPKLSDVLQRIKNFDTVKYATDHPALYDQDEQMDYESADKNDESNNQIDHESAVKNEDKDLNTKNKKDQGNKSFLFVLIAHV